MQECQLRARATAGKRTVSVQSNNNASWLALSTVKCAWNGRSLKGLPQKLAGLLLGQNQTTSD